MRLKDHGGGNQRVAQGQQSFPSNETLPTAADGQLDSANPLPHMVGSLHLHQRTAGPQPPIRI